MICEFYLIYCRSKTTTPEQYAKLVTLKSGKLDMATAYSKRPKEEVLAFWEEVRVELNSLGPPTKDGIAWKKVCMAECTYVCVAFIKYVFICRFGLTGSAISRKS